jgi:hypothetical protein
MTAIPPSPTTTNTYFRNVDLDLGERVEKGVRAGSVAGADK